MHKCKNMGSRSRMLSFQSQFSTGKKITFHYFSGLGMECIKLEIKNGDKAISIMVYGIISHKTDKLINKTDERKTKI